MASASSDLFRSRLIVVAPKSALNGVTDPNVVAFQTSQSKIVTVKFRARISNKRSATSIFLSPWFLADEQELTRLRAIWRDEAATTITSATAAHLLQNALMMAEKKTPIDSQFNAVRIDPNCS